MSDDTIDPTTGFVTHNNLTADEWEQAQTDAREAAQSARLAEPGWPDVGQGVGRGDPRGPFDLSRLNDHAYWTQNRAAILAAAAAGELPGQPNSTDHDH